MINVKFGMLVHVGQKYNYTSYRVESFKIVVINLFNLNLVDFIPPPDTEDRMLIGPAT